MRADPFRWQRPNAWASGATVGTARTSMGLVGLSRAAVLFGGETNITENAFTNSTASFNGVWSAGGNLSSARGAVAGSGSGTAALCMGGRTAITTPVTTVQSYDGATWASGTSLTGTRRNARACGTSTATLIAGGYRDGAGALSTVEAFDGVAWTSKAGLSATHSFGIFGSPTDAHKTGNAACTQATEGFNGTAWAAGQNMVGGRGYHGASGPGAGSGFVFGGYSGTATISTAEQFRTSWQTVSALVAARYGHGGAGSSSNALAVSGINITVSALLSSVEMYQ